MKDQMTVGNVNMGHGSTHALPIAKGKSEEALRRHVRHEHSNRRIGQGRRDIRLGAQALWCEEIRTCIRHLGCILLGPRYKLMCRKNL
jgi:hypothetical protein